MMSLLINWRSRVGAVSPALLAFSLLTLVLGPSLLVFLFALHPFNSILSPRNLTHNTSLDSPTAFLISKQGLALSNVHCFPTGAQTQPFRLQVFLMSLKAGGVALNLTVASRVFLMDPWSVPQHSQRSRLSHVDQLCLPVRPSPEPQTLALFEPGYA